MGARAAILGTPEAHAAFAAAQRLHLTPPRHYHDFKHVEACLHAWEAHLDAFERPDEAFWAFVFHDAIYVCGAKDNEAQSAAAAREALVGLPGLDLGAIGELISKTALHADPRMPALADAWTNDERLFVDIDAGILGTRPATYARYAKGIRAEYAFVPDELYAQGRAAFLRAMLARERLFLTEVLAHLEDPARENIAAELERLTGR